MKHTSVSRMVEAGVPITKIAKIVGWSDSTMVKMAARYGHFTLEELRSAVETITAPAAESEQPRFRPRWNAEAGGDRAN